jgi:tetratricopeptide (TPR) repeat protein
MIKRILTGALTLCVLAACGAPATPAAPAGVSNSAPGGSNAATPNPAAQTKIEASRKALQQRNYALAIAEAEAAVIADAAASGTQYALGNAYNQAAAFELDSAKRAEYFNRSVAAFQKALAINGANADARHNLGTVYFQLGQFDDARKEFEGALTIDPNDAKTHYMLGTLYLQEDPALSPQAQSKAQTEFETALKSDPNLAEAYVGLAQIFLTKGDKVKALENAQKGVSLSGANVDPFTYWQLAQAQCANGEKDAGSATIEKVRAANVPDPKFMEQVLRLASSCR